MSKAKSSGQSMARLVIVLFVITAVTALLLGLVNYITADTIAANTKKKTDTAMSAVLEADSYTAADGYSDPSGLVTAVYTALAADGSELGHVVEVAPMGFGGAISMVVGIDAEGKVSGVSIVKMTETSGLGANAKNTSFREQYVGKSGTLAVSKDGGEIEALTGATITSRAVTNGVNAALAAAASLES